MGRYIVEFHAVNCIEVEAETNEEAKAKAYELMDLTQYEVERTYVIGMEKDERINKW